MKMTLYLVLCLVGLFSLQACSGGEAISPDRYVDTDKLVSTITNNIENDPALELVVDIDHSRLGDDAGSPIAPSRVIIFSDKELESELIQLSPTAALDLPLRVLAFESGEEKKGSIIYNSFEYIKSRYQLEGDSVPGLAERYRVAMAAAVSSMPESSSISFEDNTMRPDGIITIDSPYDFDETVARVKSAIESQDDTMYFGTVDFQANAREVGVDLLPSYMILFGGPGPGGKVMSSAPTLGLDGFCQKFLVWQDSDGVTRLSFNDLLALARRHQVSIPIVLRIVDFRLGNVFEEALKAE